MPFYDLREIEQREVFCGFLGRIVHSGSMTFVHWIIQPNSSLPEHSHPHEQVVNVIDGQFELTIDGETHGLGPGTVAVIPPDASHSGRSITQCRIIDVFHPVREDYR